MRGDDPTPAIVRDRCDADDEVTVLRTPYDKVSFTRGFGESGYRLQVVEHDCPECSHDRMYRQVRVSPEARTDMRYWCLSPACPHFVGEMFNYARARTSSRKPAVVGKEGDA